MAKQFKGFKKISDDKDRVVMRRHDGHEFHILKSALTPKLRGELAAIPTHQEDTETPQNMAEGGAVGTSGASGHTGGWDVDKKKAADFSKGATKSGSVKEAFENIKKAVGMAEGGEVEQPMEEPSAFAMAKGYDIENPQPNTGPDAIEKLGNLFMPGNALPPKPIDRAPLSTPAPEASPPPSAIPTTLAPGAQAPMPEAAAQTVDAALAGTDPMAGITSAANQSKQAIQAEAQALGDQAKAQADILQKAEVARQEIREDQEQELAALDTERKALQEDIKNGHVDPHRYWGSLSTGQKISTNIGLILGGIGAGMTHGENLAYKMLQANIDRDIDAQKSDLGKKETLLSYNLKQYGNVQDAIARTRIDMQDQVANQMKAAELFATDPLVKARAAKASADINADLAAKSAAFAQQRTENKLAHIAQNDPMAAEEAISRMEMINPKRAEELRKRLVPGAGLANTEKDAGELKELGSTIQSAKQGINELLEINKIPGKSLDPKVRARAQTISASLVGLLRVPITGPGAMNEGERKMLEEIATNPTKMFSLDSSNKIRLEQLSKTLDGKFKATATSRGVKMADPIKKLPSHQRKMAEWARQNPNDPRSPILLKKLGLE